MSLHGVGLNSTVQSYAGEMELGLTACRRVLTQVEAQELIGYLHSALAEIRALPDAPVEAVAVAQEPAPVKPVPTLANKPAARKRPALKVVKSPTAPAKRAPRRKAA